MGKNLTMLSLLMTVVITGDRITTIGKAAEVKIPKINAVVTGGKLIDRAALQAMLAQAEAAAKRQ